MTWPRSPRVPTTTVVGRPTRAAEASRPPAVIVSSSGCANTPSTPPVGGSASLVLSVDAMAPS